MEDVNCPNAMVAGLQCTNSSSFDVKTLPCKPAVLGQIPALQAYAASISQCVGDFSLAFKRPVLMLIGQRDDITSVSEQNKLFESLKVSGSEIVEFDSVGHLTHYEVPRGVASAIEQWMDARDD
jgi:pimeloyl-ACP methyl ester carboxylesterase